MDEKSLEDIKNKNDLKELDNLPETIEDIESNPILKPLLEFHKGAVVLEKEDKIESTFLTEIINDIKNDLDKGIYDNSNIVRKYKNLKSEYDRLILIYSRYTDLADEKIIEMKKIVEKYYVTKKVFDKALLELKQENESLKEKLKEKKKEPEEDKVDIERFLSKPKEKEIKDDDKEYKEFLERKKVKEIKK